MQKREKGHLPNDQESQVTPQVPENAQELSSLSAEPDAGVNCANYQDLLTNLAGPDVKKFGITEASIQQLPDKLIGLLFGFDNNDFAVIINQNAPRAKCQRAVAGMIAYKVLGYNFAAATRKGKITGAHLEDPDVHPERDKLAEKLSVEILAGNISAEILESIDGQPDRDRRHQRAAEFVLD